ncbi:uncharacterized protein M421DRAFT_62135 [Didymella exigua CBS 183.55]|uniref:Uncharacterized protein n=1 Tax=Didymella exigua CBS 183.55 TaxID=1150837 RepID=A0A6A5RP49_9PLEO|nr:uncharacterized protein M421DRAFT_62135 [Didymella exigua CBS 183.55]KAF1928928.1 hypothetical protein M421DRAFT_62135 [Didymella exigua CBS 183.55]
MSAARTRQDSTMEDLEQKLAATIARGFDSNGQPCEGFYNLTRRMENEEDEQFDVDHTIQDFLAYKATSAVFEWHGRTDKWDSDLPNALVTMTAAFRSRLLQFVLLLTHRYHPTQTWTNGDSLRKLRQQNMARMTIWSRSHGLEKTSSTASRILDDGVIASARQHRASELALPSTVRLNQFSNPDRPALDQLLPLFIELTAARTCLGDEWEPTSDWFDLAGQFMLQAVIDQYVTNGHCSAECLTAIFAFGDPGAKLGSEGSDVTAMRSLFCTGDSSRTELPEWKRIRAIYIKTANGVYPLLQNGEDPYPYVKFESSLLSFLQHLHESAAKPDMVQVEEGHINVDGNELSEAESKEVISRMRLDA